MQINSDLTGAERREENVSCMDRRILRAENGRIGAVHDAHHAASPVRADVERGLGPAPGEAAA